MRIILGIVLGFLLSACATTEQKMARQTLEEKHFTRFDDWQEFNKAVENNNVDRVKLFYQAGGPDYQASSKPDVYVKLISQKRFEIAEVVRNGEYNDLYEGAASREVFLSEPLNPYKGHVCSQELAQYFISKGFSLGVRTQDATRSICPETLNILLSKNPDQSAQSAFSFLKELNGVAEAKSERTQRLFYSYQEPIDRTFDVLELHNQKRCQVKDIDSCRAGKELREARPMYAKFGEEIRKLTDKEKDRIKQVQEDMLKPKVSEPSDPMEPLCNGQSSKRIVEERIRTQKEMAAQHGVYDKKQLYEAGMWLRSLDTEIKEQTAVYVRATGKKPDYSRCDKLKKEGGKYDSILGNSN